MTQEDKRYGAKLEPHKCSSEVICVTQQQSKMWLVDRWWWIGTTTSSNKKRDEVRDLIAQATLLRRLYTCEDFDGA